MLRAFLIAIVSLLFVGSCIGVAMVGAPAIGPTIGLALVLAGLVFENHRYRRLSGQAPGGAFKATGERFIDPESGKLVEVHSDPATGARRYVAVKDAPDTP
ncbi:MAG: hypothetical protein JWO83_3935 [Caulobacteraceae bacterium]|jgi:hypothetical protein|nr:hypothetical protein [Caulobacteraceae bacterium]